MLRYVMKCLRDVRSDANRSTTRTMTRKTDMAPSAKNEAARARAKSKALMTHYRAIGPACVAAALLFTRKPASATKR